MRPLIAAALLFAGTPAAVAGQALQAGTENGGRPTIVATRLLDGESIALDGRLDEPVWSRARPGGDFMQVDPDNGRPATEKTEVRIALDADALYLGITCYDSQPNGWIAYQRRRDEGLPSDDKIQIIIDTFLDARTGYFFELNPPGSDDGRAPEPHRHEPRVGRHLERARPAERDRLDARDRAPVPHVQLQPEQRHVGHQLSALSQFGGLA